MPSSPSSLPSALVLLFAVACGLSVANVYYAQPLLDVLGAEFAIGQAGVGLLFGATQAGCALALLLVVPLGDPPFQPGSRQLGLPISGCLQLGRRRYDCQAGQSFAALDFGRGVWPLHT
ncbi:DUF2804 family protein, partial [Pseudomonas aeruginosa]|uniref:DUF2804 family protein n=1 Tax=Pseudomonas aeruginosa TaxID=287 RepID=UPI003D2C17AE